MLPALAVAQALRQPLAIHYVGLSAYSVEQPDVFGFTTNQAALAQLEHLSAGVYGERKFLLASTSLYAGVIGIPSKMGNFGFNFRYSGFRHYTENQVGVAYAKSLGKMIDLGMQFNYYGYKVPAYTNAHTASVEFGALVHFSSKLNVGLHVYNPMGGNFSKAGEKLCWIYKLGLGYDASEQVFLFAELVQQEACPLAVNAGLQYRFEQQFFLRLGVATLSSTAYIGAGLQWKKLRLDVTTAYHPQLGISPGLLLMSDPGKK